MLANSQNMFLGKRAASSKYFFDENDDMLLYSSGYESNSFDVDYKGLIIDEIDFFYDLDQRNFPSESTGVCDNLSFRIDSDLSETGSQSDLEADISVIDERFEFNNNEKNWQECPEEFKEKSMIYNDF